MDLLLLALHQQAAVVAQFRNIGLPLRLECEFKGFAEAEPGQRGLCIQLLGTATLFGQLIHVRLFSNMGYRDLAPLPTDTLPHRDEAEHVEEWQYQLWLGLRAVVAVTRKPLWLAPGVIRRTRDLWLRNLEHTGAEPESAAHRVDRQMVAWLDLCLARGEFALQPPQSLLLLPELGDRKLTPAGMPARGT